MPTAVPVVQAGAPAQPGVLLSATPNERGAAVTWAYQGRGRRSNCPQESGGTPVARPAHSRHAPRHVARVRSVTHSLGELDHLGHVVAESGRRDLAEHVEEGVAIGVDEVIAARLVIVADEDVGARVLDLVDLGGLGSVQDVDTTTYGGFAGGAGDGVGVDLGLGGLVGDEIAGCEGADGAGASAAGDAEGGESRAHHLG